jgi:NTP pyrophosphatase (non-canonical NTP hydrolase)
MSAEIRRLLSAARAAHDELFQTYGYYTARVQPLLKELEDAMAALPGSPQKAPPLTFDDLVQANLSRVVRWHPGGLHEWSPLEWAGAMAGEAGEACNAAKKLKRIDGQLANINHEAGRSLTERQSACRQIAKEVADTIIYGALLVSAADEDLGATIVEVFNRKSEEYGFPERLRACPEEPAAGTI